MAGGVWPPRGGDRPGEPGPAAWESRATELAQRFGIATRGLLLPLFAWPLLPDVIVEIIKGNPRGLVAALLGLFLPLLAVRRLRRGRAGSVRGAAVIVAVATGLVAGLGAKMAMPMPVLLAAMAWAGTRLLYDGTPEAAPEPPPAEAPAPSTNAVALAAARLSALEAAGVPRLAPVLSAMRDLLADLQGRPERLDLARRFLTVHLDGLERIAARLAAGATPPEGLAPLLTDLETAARDLSARLRAEESAALDIQVKVLAERLRQEGYG
jgi:hypothetical protein